MTSLDIEAGTTTVVQRPTTSSSNSDESEESLLDSLEEGRTPLLDDELSHYSGSGRIYPKRSSHKIPKERYKTGVRIFVRFARDVAYFDSDCIGLASDCRHLQ